MQRTYTRFKYSEQDLALALEAIRSGRMILSDASKQYNIPKSTLHNKVLGKVPNIRKMGPRPILSKDEEDRLQNWIISKAKLGFPMHANEVKDAVQKILKTLGRTNPFCDDRPGDKWLNLFLKRNPNISIRNTEIISKSRASVTELAIREWFSELRTFLENQNVLDSMMNDASRIFNADETGVRTCTQSGLVLAPKNYKNVYEIASGSEKESITVLCNYSASGIAAPPMVIFPYKRVPKDLALTVPKGWAIGRSDSGWMTAATFFEYVANIFYPWLVSQNIAFPIILFIDGHKSHYNLELYEFCIEKHMFLYCLYPNATHILQPCDVSIFRPLKVQWKEVCRNYKQKTNAAITRHNFCPLFKEAFEKANKPITIINGFKVCGLYPLNPDAVDYSKCISTRRNELFPKNVMEKNDLTSGDYTSTLNVLKQFLGKDKINRFYELLNDDHISNDDKDMYCFWKYCKSNQDQYRENNNSLPLEAPLTDSFLDNIPIEINGILYPAPLNNNVLEEIEVLTPEVKKDHENEHFIEAIISENNNETVLTITSESELQKNCEITNAISQNSFNGKVENKNKEIEGENVYTEKECRGILNTILEETFKIVENKMEYVYDAAEDMNKNKHLSKIKIISNITIKNEAKDRIDDSVWKEHMHWPKQELELKKRKKREIMPFAITSSKWIEFQQEEENKKREKEENIKKRKLEREQKKIEKEAKQTKTKHSSKLKSLENGLMQENKKPEKGGNIKKRKLDGEHTKIEKEAKQTKTQHSSKLKSLENGPTSFDSDTQFAIGDYAVVYYEGKYYPGLIKNIKNKEYEISVLHKITKNRWKWPTPVDQIWYKAAEIIKKVPAPVADGTKGIFVINL